MKLSDAMEVGYAKVGKQYFKNIWPESYTMSAVESGRLTPTACCAFGAALCGGLRFEMVSPETRDYVISLNDQCRMPIPEIIEVLRGMGL